MTGAGWELADELRALIGQLHELDVSEADLRRAAAEVRALRARLDGPRRPRWFEEGLDEGRSSRQGRQRYAVHSLYRGTANPLAIPMTAEFVRLPDGREALKARVVVPPTYEGPPHGVHGGYVAGMFDDVLGGTQALIEGPGGLTGTLTVRYRAITPLSTELVFRGWVAEEKGRRIVSRATCHAGDVLTAEAEALFVRVDMAAIAEQGQPVEEPPPR